MPLERIAAPQFLFRRRVFLDPYINTINTSSPMFDNTVEVPYHPGKVTSLEISDYAIPRDYTGPVLIEADRTGINSWLDLRLQTYPVVSATLDLSFQINSTRNYVGVDTTSPFQGQRFSTANATINAFLESLADSLDVEMDFANDPTFSTINGWNFVVTAGQVFPSGRYGAVHIELRNSNTPGTGTVQFLGATGANAGNQAWNVFGFEEGVDTPATQTIDGTLYVALIQSRYLNLFPYRYVDVTFDELPELSPHSRFWTTSSSDYKYNEWAVERPRLLTDPPRRLERLTARIRVQNDNLPNQVTFAAWNFTTEIIQVSPETEVPAWVEQFLSFD